MFNAKLFWRLLLIAAICLGGFLIYRTLSRYSFDDIVSSVGSIPLARLAGALGFAACSYFCLTFFDMLGLRYAGKPLPYRKAALTSFVSLSIGHNIGVAALSSGAIRYRFYSRWGLDAGDVANVVVFSGATVALGLATLAGLAILARSAAAAEMTGLGQGVVLALGLGCLAAVATYLLLSVFLRSSWSFRGWKLQMPKPTLALCQIAIGFANFALVAACLHQIVTAFAGTAYLKVATVYALANATALVSHVPGGLGVLEAAILYLLPGTSLIGAVIAFRFVYFLVPLTFGLPLLLLSEGVFLGRKKTGRKQQSASHKPA